MPFPSLGRTALLLASLFRPGPLQAGELHLARTQTILFKVYGNRFGGHALELVKGQGRQGTGDQICIGPERTGKVTATLSKPGDRFVFPPGDFKKLDYGWDVTFRPNLPGDGTEYRVKIANTLSKASKGKRKDEFVSFQVARPSSKVYTRKEGRVLTIRPDWSAPDGFFLDPNEQETDAIGRPLDRKALIDKDFKNPQDLNLGTGSL